MAKQIVFFFFFCVCTFYAHAQKDFEYVDSSLLYGKDSAVMGQNKPVFKNDSPVANTEEGDNIEKESFADTSIFSRPVAVTSDSVKLWKNEKQYAYLQDLETKLRQYQSEKIKNVQNDSRGFFSTLISGSLFKIILISLAAALVLYVIYQLFLSKGFFSKSSKKKAVREVLSEEELLLNNDFGQHIREATRIGDFRAATRFQFLKILHRLNDQNMISFKTDKTNIQYLYELPEAARNDFSVLVMHYEYVWYGNMPIGQAVYDTIEAKFASFSKKY